MVECRYFAPFLMISKEALQLIIDVRTKNDIRIEINLFMLPSSNITPSIVTILQDNPFV